ncbi:MAG TPA: hypothetical protein VIF15_18395, partial [Polyangiaceae bacterium]
IAESWDKAVQHCLLLGVINFMYFMRARTEERHLGHDPTYVKYALWMNDHGVLRFLNRIPGIRYKAPGPPVAELEPVAERYY